MEKSSDTTKNKVKQMKEGKVDKRVLKTKNAIFNAFKALVEEKDIADISISELTKDAGITRSTFYMYYNSVADVRDDIENEIIARIGKIMTEDEIGHSLTNPYRLLSTVADEITRQDQNNRYILSSSSSGRLLDKINDKIVESYIKSLSANPASGGMDIKKAKYVVAFAVAGMTECFKIWFNHKSSLTLEELCVHISDTMSKGISYLFDGKLN